MESNNNLNLPVSSDNNAWPFIFSAHGDKIHQPVATNPILNSQQVLAAFNSSLEFKPLDGMNSQQPSTSSSGTMVNDMQTFINAQSSLAADAPDENQPQTPVGFENPLQEIYQRRKEDLQREQQSQNAQQVQPRQLLQSPSDNIASNRTNDQKNKENCRVQPKFKNPSKIVTFLVGEHQAKFCIHKDVVCHYSPVLNEQLNIQVEEGKEQEDLLEEVSKETFSILLHWLYNDRVQTLQLDPDFEKEGGYESVYNKAKAAEENTNLVQAWVLGDQLDIPRFQNDIADAIFEIARAAAQDHFDTKDLGYVWENTDADSPLRTLFIRLVMCGDIMDSEGFDDTPDDFPKEFLLQFAKFGKMEDFGQDLHMSEEEYHFDVSGDDFGCGKKRYRKRDEYEDDEDDEE